MAVAQARGGQRPLAGRGREPLGVAVFDGAAGLQDRPHGGVVAAQRPRDVLNEQRRMVMGRHKAGRVLVKVLDEPHRMRRRQGEGDVLQQLGVGRRHRVGLDAQGPKGEGQLHRRAAPIQQAGGEGGQHALVLGPSSGGGVGDERRRPMQGTNVPEAHDRALALHDQARWGESVIAADTSDRSHELFGVPATQGDPDPQGRHLHQLGPGALKQEAARGDRPGPGDVLVSRHPRLHATRPPQTLATTARPPRQPAGGGVGTPRRLPVLVHRGKAQKTRHGIAPTRGGERNGFLKRHHGLPQASLRESPNRRNTTELHSCDDAGKQRSSAGVRWQLTGG